MITNEIHQRNLGLLFANQWCTPRKPRLIVSKPAHPNDVQEDVWTPLTSHPCNVRNYYYRLLEVNKICSAHHVPPASSANMLPKRLLTLCSCGQNLWDSGSDQASPFPFPEPLLRLHTWVHLLGFHWLRMAGSFRTEQTNPWVTLAT